MAQNCFGIQNRVLKKTDHDCRHHHCELRALAGEAVVIGGTRCFETGCSVWVNLLKISVGSYLTFSFFSQSICVCTDE